MFKKNKKPVIENYYQTNPKITPYNWINPLYIYFKKNYNNLALNLTFLVKVFQIFFKTQKVEAKNEKKPTAVFYLKKLF